MKEELYTNSLGKLISNLHSIEYSLRAFLAKYHEHQEPKVNISNLNKGDIVQINSFTNYDSLGQLINKYNNIIRSENLSEELSTDIVEIRDMIAHGRVASPIPKYPMQLLKFGKPRNNTVPVEYSIVLDKEWFDSHLDLTHKEFRKIQSSSNKLQMDIMQDV